MKLIVEICTEYATTWPNDFENCMAISVGKMIKLGIRSAPSNLMPNTITSEQIIAKIASYTLVFIPIAFAKSSSKVIAKMRLCANIHSKVTTIVRIKLS